MNILTHNILPSLKKFRFLVIAILFLAGLSQSNAVSFEENNKTISDYKYLHFQSLVISESNADCFIENAEIEEEEREDDEQQHKNFSDFAYTNAEDCFATVIFAHFFTPIHLRVEPLEHNAPQKIPLYALHCSWRHHLA